MSEETDSLTEDPGSRGDVERYGLMAAVTLLIVLFLVVDEQRATAPPRTQVQRDSVVVLELGGRDVRSREMARRGQEGADRQADPGPIDPAPTPDPTPPEPVPPVSTEPRTVIVQPGDSLSQISERELGTHRRTGEILELNGLRDANSIQAGQTLRLPPR